MPKTAVPSQVIARAVEVACRAPSLHNSQPWRWVATATAVDLFADPRRVLRSTDSTGREALISCGAVLDHFRVAMAATGWNTDVDEFPDPDEPEHLASIDFTPLDCVTRAWRDRADAILRRRSDRLPFAAPPHWEAFEDVLRSSIDADLASLDVLSDEARPQLAEASQLTAALRRHDDLYHQELQWWTAPFRDSEGIPPSSLVSRSEADRVGVDRGFPVSGYGDRRAATGRDRAKILVLSTPEDTRVDAFHAGQVVSGVLLECTMAGLATCPLTHITELAASRDIIADLIGRKIMPQILIRVGIAPDVEEVPPPTPRRPLSEVLEIRR
ncbi:NAD(P)H nitroreductase [Mycobacterium sp.]|uniref:Acg family FMN-binding oxidoreductase n=1 Tax=Mycobacterium sp. TaxID=1785 RepID=UPI001271BAEE|nr:NAD(P)H nitroreductase [Mycobacterium sp.]KAA8964662.1 MAG: NAD(P)H nitroreductase [Mycobacterium sp.]